MKMTKGVVVIVLTTMAVFSASLVAKDFSPWAQAKASMQAVWWSDLEDESAWEIKRARVGVDGEFTPGIYFKVEVDGSNTKKGKGTELKAAFISFSILDNHMLDVDVGAITTAFTRPLSGTEYAFINYDITTSLDAYQYGAMAKGVFLDGMIGYYLAMVNGEGYGSINVGNGYCYIGRVEIQPFGGKPGKFADLREGSALKDDMLAIGLAAAIDNKSETSDYGVTFQNYSSSHFVADLTFRFAGASLFGQYNMNSYEKKYDGNYWGGINKNVKESNGGFVQAAYNLGAIGLPNIEPIVKYEFWKEIVNEGVDDMTFKKANFAVGANWYFAEHKFKLTTEYRHVVKDDYYATYITKPGEDYFGVRLTYSFSSPKIEGKSAPAQKNLAESTNN